VTLAPGNGATPSGTTRLYLTSAGVTFDSRPIATLADLRGAIHTAGAKERMAQSLSLPAAGDVLVYVDRATPYDALASLVDMLGYAQVRSDRVELMVAAPAGTAAIRLAPPGGQCSVMLGTLSTSKIATLDALGEGGSQAPSMLPEAAPITNANDVPCHRAPSEPKLALSVFLVAQGFIVSAAGQRIGEGCKDTGAGVAVPGRDTAALKACVSRLKHVRPEFEAERDVIIGAPDATRFDELAPLLSALRTDADGGALFDEITLAQVR
jgi:hypothetical protein